MDEDSEDIDDALADLLKTLSASRPDIDLVLDLGVVDGDLSVRAGSRLIADALRGLAGIDEWRNIVVTAGAFPTDLSACTPWTLGEPPRYDAMMYDHLRQRRRLPRVPIFGDYAVANPVLVTGLPHRAPPQLRYTVADRWLVLKGRVNDPRGHEQFYDVCDIVARHPDFAGVPLGDAMPALRTRAVRGQVTLQRGARLEQRTTSITSCNASPIWASLNRFASFKL